MSKTKFAICMVLVFALGAAVGVGAAKKPKGIDSNLYVGKSADEAAEALLAIAKVQAGSGTWERIHTARVYMVSGRKQEGQAIIDSVLGGKAAAGDVIRVGRVYYQMGDWDRAREMFDKALSMAPKDQDWMAEIGAYYNLQGDREKAEQLFGSSFAIGISLKNTLSAAGSYVGVEPRRR